MAADGSVQIETTLNTDPIRRQVSEMDREMRRLERSVNNSQHGMEMQAQATANQMERSYRRYYRYMTDEQRAMQMEMKNFYREQSEAMRVFSGRQVEIQHGYFQISQAAQDFQGTNAEFLAQLEAQGTLQRKLNDEMMAANKAEVMAMHQAAGAMLARSTVASKITAQYERMSNPIYSVNNAFLSVAGSLQRVAMAGDPAVTAIRMLGPTANAKQLNDLVRQLGTQLMGLPIIAMGAAAATAMVFGTLHQVAMDTSSAYNEAFSGMRDTVIKALVPMVQAFVMLAVPIFNVVTAVAELVVKFNEAHPVIALVLQGILMLVPALVLILSPLALGVGLVNGFIVAWAELWLVLGPVVTGLGAMMGTVLLVAAAIMVLTVGLYALWQNSETFRNGVYASIEAIKVFGQAILDFGKYIWSVIAVGDPMNDWLGHLPKGFQGAALAIGEGVNQIRDFLAALGQYFFWVAADGDTMNDWLTHLPKGFQDTALLLGEGVNMIREQLIALVDAIKLAFTGDFSQITTIFATLIPTILGVLVGGFPALLLFFARFVPDIGAKIQEATPILINVFNTLLQQVITFLTTQLPVLLQVGVEIITSIIEGLIQALPLIVDALTTVFTTLVEIATTMLPIVMEVGVQLLTAIIEGILSLLPVLLDTAMNLILTLINGILEMLPTLIDTIVNLVTKIIETLIAALPKILEMGVKILMTLIDGIVKILPKLITTIVNLITQVVQTIIQNLPKLIDSGMKILNSLINGIIKILPQLITTAVKLVFEIQKAVIQNLPTILKAGVQILEALIKGIVSLVKNLYNVFTKDVLGQIKTAAKSFGSDALQLGKDIVNGLIKGITSMGGAAAKAIKGIASGALEAAKDFLGVHSPSRVFRDEVGKWIPAGIAVGVEDNTAVLDKQIQASVDSAVDVGNMSTRSGMVGSNTTNNITKAPVSIELIYQGSGDEQDAYAMLDFLEKEAQRRQFGVAFTKGVAMG